MFMIVHLEIEEAAKIFKGFADFNYWQELGVDEKLGLNL